ncbi:MAG: DNA recombination and repair protein RecF [uncultured Solirubrobacteraceae bacterium]|uniref:DNA replication and repair protein RecF n=1 Tax=uncultured Solirubrobacteraceae bacterium TaxID=1162706 RepID=A0A6J4TTL6_9ACTN|nr:MAG: DNA recombination and repair protein RecF [uncultured Solirubrobacteraceae bacterium]
MFATRLRLRDFRSYERADVELGDGLTVVHGRNGAGKTNLLEALYFGCTGRSCRTSNEREVVRFDASTARVEVDLRDEEGRGHALAVGFSPGEAKRLQADGVAVERLVDVEMRPLVCVFMPDRLELVKGPPALRRSHIDQVIAASWPARSATRRAYSRALAQRNALLAAIRGGRASRESLRAWDAELARHGIALRDDRAAVVDLLARRFGALAGALGLGTGAELRYRPRSKAPDAGGLTAELAERVESDLERGFTGHGPHRDDVVFLRAGRELRAYGSQGEQRLALLALLLAERQTLAEERDTLPLMLLDDVMSELDPDRRAMLADLLRGGGQSVITTTDLAHVPGSEGANVTRLAVSGGAVLRDTAAAA